MPKTPREEHLIMTEIEITTAADRAAPPAGHVSLEQLTALLNAAATLAAAQRPIVLAGPEAYPAPSASAAPVHAAYGYPTPAPAGPGHPGIDVDLTGHGYSLILPANLTPLPPVPESRSFAPLAFLVSGTAFIASAFGTAVTGGNPLLIASTLGLLAGTGVAFSRIVGNGVNR
jgi:hypothetical protein